MTDRNLSAPVIALLGVVVLMVVMLILVPIAGSLATTNQDAAVSLLESDGFSVFAAGQAPTDTPTFLVCSSTAQANQCDYEADGADDHVQIQQAIDDCPAIDGAAGGCSVILTEGEFSMGGTTEVRGNLDIRGQGVNATSLFMQAVDGPMFEFSQDNTTEFFWYLGHMRLRGNDALSGRCIDIGTGAGTSEIRDGRLEYIFCSNFPDGGIRISTGWGWVWDHVVSEFHTGGWSGEVLGGTAFRAIDSKFTQSDVNGGLRVVGERASIVNTFFSTNQQEGLSVEGNFLRCIGCDFANNGQDSSSPNVRVADDVNRTIISGSTFRGGSTTVNGLIFNSGTQRAKIIGNTFEGHTGDPYVNNGTGTNELFANDGADNNMTVLIPDGSGVAPGLAFTESTNTGFRRNPSGDLHMIRDGSIIAAFRGSSIVTGSDGAIDLGASGLQWRDIWASRDLYLTGLPTSDPGVAGQVWNDAGTLKISSGS